MSGMVIIMLEYFYMPVLIPHLVERNKFEQGNSFGGTNFGKNIGKSYAGENKLRMGPTGSSVCPTSLL
jgi:hypothetical protein